MNLSLFPDLEPPSRRVPRPRPERSLAPVRSGPLPHRQRHPVLWLCLCFPSLVMEALAPEGDRTCLVVEGEGASGEVVAVNRAARDAGVSPGMRLSAALARVHAPKLLRRDSGRERQCLERAADAAMGFTDRVSLLPGEGLLLEVRGSLRLFGGVAVLREQLLDCLHALGHEPVHGVAPTPLAALWLARAGDGAVVEERAALPARLGRLPLGCLDLERDTLRHLDGIGIRRLADLFRLPRAGLSRRWGPSLRGQLDRALGQQPDPRPCWRGTLRFSAYRELPMESAATGELLQAAKGMVAELVRFLRRHDSDVERVVLRMHHHRRGVTDVTLGMPGVARQVEAIRELLSVRMESVVLPAPAIALSLISSPLCRHRSGNRGLFRETSDSAREQALLARLRARLGEERVFGIASRARHRPEAGWCRSSPGDGGEQYRRMDRPLWLLSVPRPLPSRRGLHPLSGPERIETGWWEGRDITRDYYRVLSREGHEYWIFRDRRDNRWFLHGLFG